MIGFPIILDEKIGPRGGKWYLLDVADPNRELAREEHRRQRKKRIANSRKKARKKRYPEI